MMGGSLASLTVVEGVEVRRTIQILIEQIPNKRTYIS